MRIIYDDSKDKFEIRIMTIMIIEQVRIILMWIYISPIMFMLTKIGIGLMLSNDNG